MKRVLKRSELEELRSVIRLRADEGRAVNARIRKKRGPERAAERQEKARIGDAAREALLAYGFLRGRSYAEMEAKTSADTNYHWMTGQVAALAVVHSPDGERPSVESAKAEVRVWMGVTP